MPDGNSELLERSEATEAIAASLAVACQGRLSVLFVIGEAGLGKSALLEQAPGLASGFRVGRASGEASETVLPFGVIGRALDLAGARGLTRPAPEVPVEERAAAVWYRVRDWLASRTAPVLLCLDDLHFADPDSLSLVGFLARHLGDAPVALLGGLRPWPPGPLGMAEELVSRNSAGLVRLAPLSTGASVALYTRTAGCPPPAELGGRLEALCAGNPALLRQLAAVTSSSAEPVTRDRNDPRRLLLGRFTGLDASSLDYARAAAVLGVEFRPALAGVLAGLDEISSRAALAALCGAGLVVDVGDGLVRFTHALLHQALYEDIARPLRAQLHRAAFRSTREAGLPASEAASHALAGDLIGDRSALEVLEAAAQDALERGATALALRWLRGAGRLAGAMPSAPLLARIADGLLAAGEAGEAADVCRKALSALPGPTTVATANRVLARALARLGRAAEVEEAFERAAAAVATEDPEMACEVLLEASQVSLYTSGPRRALHFADRARTMLADGVPSELAAWVYAARGMARLMQAERQGALEILESLSGVGPISDLSGSRASPEWGPWLQQLQAHKSLELFDAAERDYQMAVAEAGHEAPPVTRAVYEMVHADTLSRMGRLAESRDALHRSLEALAFAPARGVWTMVGLAHVHLELGQPEDAARYCGQIEGLVGDEGESMSPLRLWLWRVRAVLALDAGDAGAACRLMARAEALVDRVGAYEPGLTVWHPVAIASYLAAGRCDDAGRVVERLEVAGRAIGTRFPRAVACRGRAQLAERAGDVEAAGSYFTAAIAWHEGLAMPLEEVETLIAYGEFLRRHRLPSVSRPVLGRAVMLAGSHGARRLEARALAALHAAGGRRRHGSTSTRSLTPMERRVAELAAAGRTNNEIGRLLVISPRTVEHHLTKIYGRLGIGSRRQLQQALNGHEPPEQFHRAQP